MIFFKFLTSGSLSLLFVGFVPARLSVSCFADANLVFSTHKFMSLRQPVKNDMNQEFKDLARKNLGVFILSVGIKIEIDKIISDLPVA